MSQVVLRKFARNGQLSVYDRSQDRVFAAAPRTVFKHPNFIAHEAQVAEDRWGLVETKIPKAYQALDDPVNALADPAIVDLLRDILAMHWARNPATKAVHEQVGHDVFQESRLKFARDPELLGRVFRWRTGGLYPAGVSSLLWANDELHRLPPEVLEQWFAERNGAH